MTALATVFTSTSIIMSGDSLMLLGSKKDPIGQRLVQKVFIISSSNTGISAIGDGLKDGIYLQSILKNFVSNLNLSDETPQALIAEELGRYMNENYPQFDTSFYVCGYNDGEPYVFELLKKTRLKPRRVNIHPNGSIRYSIIADLLPETVQELQCSLPSFKNMSDDEVISYLQHVYDLEIANQEKRLKIDKRPIDVSKPISYIVIKNGSHKIISVYSLEDTYLD